MGKKKQRPQESEAAPGLPLFWRNPTHLVGKGTVIGLADPEDLEAFKAATASIPGFNLDKWVTTEPPAQKVKRMIA